MTEILAHLRRGAVPYVALLIVLVVGLGGGYALAASKTKTITACADKKTGILHLKTRGGKCKRGQTRVTWNQKGPQGPQGAPGSTGQQGAPAVSVWANVTNAGVVAFGQGIAVQHISSGVYEVTITAPACAHGSNAPVVSVSDGSPPVGQVSGAFPVAWYESTGANQQFMVLTGVVPAPGPGNTYSGLTLSDHTFDVMDACM
jgi:hypothetical protein